MKRTVASLLVVLGVFCVYRVTVVPLVEPQQQPKRVVAVSPEQRAASRQSQNHLGSYARFFPPGSWELDNPIIMDSSTAKYLVKEYKSEPNHRIILTPCTVIYLPDGDAEQADNHHRVIILQAHRAELQFDDQENLDAGSIGHLLGGIMEGPITIQSGPTCPDGGDDFLVTAHDAQLKDNLIFTPNEVNFRFGASHGYGRNMRIELLRDQKAGDSHGTNFSGVQSFQLLTDVHMHLQPGSSGFLPGDQSTAASRTTNLSAPTAGSTNGQLAGADNNPPVDIQCQGPFEFDLVENVATFHDRVDVVRPHPNGPSDQLNCELLNLYFGPRQPPPGAAAHASQALANNSPADSATHRMPQLEPKRLVARGNPVVVRAELMQGELRGEHLEYDILQRHLLMDAAGKNVHIESPQLSGEVSQLEAWVRDAASADGAAPPGGSTGNQSRNPAEPAGTFTSPGNQNTNSRRQHYEIYGGLLKIWSVNHASQNEVERVTVEGNVQFAQSPAQSGEKPLETKGDYLEVLRANTPDAEVNISGQPAEIIAQGLTLRGQSVHLNRGQNRLWIDGPGRMIITSTQPPQNGATAAENNRAGLLASSHGVTTIDWKEGMLFDGRTAKFAGEVVGQRSDNEITQTIRAPELEATLHERVDFNAANPGQQQRSSIEWLTCRGGAWLENRQTQHGAVTVLDQMEHLASLQVNQITGDLIGEATEEEPGQLLSWRLGAARALMGGLGRGPSAARAGANAAGNLSAPQHNPGGAASGANSNDPNRLQINYLNVQFHRGISGNVLRRELVFQEQVRTVYGPVPDWNSQLDPDSPAGLPPGSFLLTCDQLATNQSAPVQGRSLMEMQATGNARVEGQQQEGDTFTAMAQQLNYSEAKDMLVLLGDGRSDAQLFRQPQPGAPQSHTVARSIYYWPSTREMKLDLRFVDSTQLSADPPPRKAPATTPSAAQQPVSPPRR
ncbi:MAG TPA: hypothetical protein VFE46_13075 [Pirellulales bacterium]|jgi:lipopolysaccharide export system protein LptA|nr:hypothetical protein [Pirellulales bacterium]